MYVHTLTLVWTLNLSSRVSQKVQCNSPFIYNLRYTARCLQRCLIFAGIKTGEDGTIGSPSKAYLKISANDDPNGLLKFSVGSVEIPEDFIPGMEATTVKNLTVLRNQGTWGTVRVGIEEVFFFFF